MEEPQKLKRNNQNEDRISNLPHNIIQKILGLLPKNEVVRTSELSKEWRFSWMSLPNAVLIKGYHYWSDREFYTFIERTLYRYLSKLHVTDSVIMSFDSTAASWYLDGIKSCVGLCLETKSHELSIEFSREWVYGAIASERDLPLCFYDHNPFLRKLILKCCFFGPLPKAVSWVSLRVLLLYEVVGVSNDTLGAIFSGCQVLECLSLYRFRCIDARIRFVSTTLKVLVLNHLFVPESSVANPVVIEISCPNLLLLAIMGRVEFMPLYGGPAPFSCLKWVLIDVSSLVDSIIDFDLSKHDVIDAQCWRDFKCFFVDDLLQKLNHVARFTIGTDCNEERKFESELVYPMKNVLIRLYKDLGLKYVSKKKRKRTDLIRYIGYSPMMRI